MSLISARVAARYFLSKLNYEPLLTAVKRQDVVESERLLSMIREVFRPGEGGGMFRGSTPTAGWYTALGPRESTRALRLYHELGGIQSDLAEIKKDQDPARRWGWLGDRIEAQLPELKWLQSKTRATAVDTDKGIQHGPFTVIQMSRTTQKNAEGAMEALDAAAAAIQSKFPEVLYGNVYLSNTLGRGGEKGWITAALYNPPDDSITVSLKVRKSHEEVRAICHEFGHRFEKRFLKDPTFIKTFADLVNQYGHGGTAVRQVPMSDADRARAIDELIAQVSGRPVQDATLVNSFVRAVLSSPVSRKFLEFQREVKAGDAAAAEALRGTLLREGPAMLAHEEHYEPLYVTPYAARVDEGKQWPSENFAECFSFYVLGMKLPEPLEWLMRKLH